MLVGFAGVERRHFRLPPGSRDAGRHETEGNVRRVEPVMGDRRDRIRHRRRTVWKAGRTERRLARKAAVEVPSQLPAERPLVVGGKLHEQIVRVLAVVNRVAFADLAAREKIDAAAVGNGPGLGAEHRTQAETPAAQGPARHQHDPVDAAQLMLLRPAGAMDIARFVQVLQDASAVQHQLASARPRTRRRTSATFPESRLFRRPRVTGRDRSAPRRGDVAPAAV